MTQAVRVTSAGIGAGTVFSYCHEERSCSQRVTGQGTTADEDVMPPESPGRDGFWSQTMELKPAALTHVTVTSGQELAVPKTGVLAPPPSWKPKPLRQTA